MSAEFTKRNADRKPGRPKHPNPVCARQGCDKRTPNTRRKYCSPAHNPMRDRGFITFSCTWCGKVVQQRRTEWEYKQKHWARNPLRKKPQTDHFCNYVCKGKFTGQNYGFAAHSENSGRHST